MIQENTALDHLAKVFFFLLFTIQLIYYSRLWGYRMIKTGTYPQRPWLDFYLIKMIK